MSQQPFDPTQGPGDVDMVLGAELVNPHRSKTVKVISGEFEHLNGKQISPGQALRVNLLVPAGYREFINPTEFKGQHYIYVGLVDKDTVEPLIHKPKL